MQDQNRPIETGSRSSIDRPPVKRREAVDQAVADGATIDETTALIRAEVEGDVPPPSPRPPRIVTSVPVDPWNPAESRSSQLIPADPGESRLISSSLSHGMTERSLGGDSCPDTRKGSGQSQA